MFESAYILPSIGRPVRLTIAFHLRQQMLLLMFTTYRPHIDVVHRESLIASIAIPLGELNEMHEAPLFFRFVFNS